MRYTLRCRDDIRLCFEIDPNKVPTEAVAIGSALGVLPWGCTASTINGWLKNRLYSHNTYLSNYLDLPIIGRNLDIYLAVSHAVSLNDCFWIASESEPLITWDMVSPYCNQFNLPISNASYDLPYAGRPTLLSAPEITLRGKNAKCWRYNKGCPVLHKRHVGDIRITMMEAFASLLYNALGVGVRYDPVTEYGSIGIISSCICTEDISYVPATYVLNKSKWGINTILRILEKLSIDDHMFRCMVLLDSISGNVFRSSWDFGIMVDAVYQRPVEMALCMDYGDNKLDRMLQHYADEHTSLPCSSFMNFTGIDCVADHSLLPELETLRDMYFKLPFYVEAFTEEEADILNIILKDRIDFLLHYMS